MKFNLFIPLIIGFFASGIVDSRATSPLLASGDDTIIAKIPDTIPAFVAPVASALPVNESEVRAGLLYDAVNQKVIWEKNSDKAFPIASLTKMMVALLAVEDVRAGKFTWEDNLTWTRTTIVGRRKSTRKKIYTNVNYSLRDVFKASMIASNNECAEQLARYLSGGSLQPTIDRMNTRAKELNMNSTYYGNPTGLPAPHRLFDNTSSPNDLLILTMEMLNYNEIIEIAAMGYASIENGKSKSVISNHNHLTIDFSGEVDGLKTGYTKRAGFCLVATTAKCDHRLVSIVLGCRGPQIRNEVVRDMFNDYYTSIALDRLGPMCPSPGNDMVSTQKGDGHYVTVSEKVPKSHIVKYGESLSTIASKYGCSTSQLRSWNKKNAHSSKIYKGQRLTVYVKQPKSIFIENPANGDESEDDKPLLTQEEKKTIESEDQPEVQPVVAKPVTPKKDHYLYHVVAPGDTLFSIAQRYEGITVQQLKELNKITNSRNLKPGTRLKVKVQG